jgi:hypothetical protein
MYSEFSWKDVLEDKDWYDRIILKCILDFEDMNWIEFPRGSTMAIFSVDCVQHPDSNIRGVVLEEHNLKVFETNYSGKCLHLREVQNVGCNEELGDLYSFLSITWLLKLGWTCGKHEGVSKSFRTGRLERELQMVKLSATRYSCITILWVTLVSFAAITICIASHRVIRKVSVYFLIDSVRKLLDTPLYTYRISVMKPLGGQLLTRLRRRWGHTTERGFRETGCEDVMWIKLAQVLLPQS